MLKQNCPPLATLCLALAPFPGDLLVPEDYASIQTAIDNAQYGDTIDIAAGIYYETLVIPHMNIELRGRTGHAATILDAAGAGSVVSLNWTAPETLPATLELVGLTLQGGQASLGGGIFATGQQYDPSETYLRIDSCNIKNNAAQLAGGGIYAYGFLDVRISNTMVSGNSLIGGGAPWLGGAGVLLDAPPQTSALVEHCTIVDNEILGNADGAGIFTSVWQLTVRNSILRRNTDNGSVDPIHWYFGLDPVVEYSNFENAVAHNLGAGNLGSNPRFVSTPEGDYHLKPDSPCIDTTLCGTPSGLVDFEGDQRTQGGCPDMGADEWAPHLYHLAPVSAGPNMIFRVAGLTPGDQVSIWLDRDTLSTPTSLPFGSWWLASRGFAVTLGSTVPTNGTLSVPINLPASLPMGMPLYAQALAAGELSNLETLLVP